MAGPFLATAHHPAPPSAPDRSRPITGRPGGRPVFL